MSANRRGADVFELAGRHSRRVKVLKFAIPAVTLVAAGMFSAATFFRSELPVSSNT